MVSLRQPPLRQSRTVLIHFGMPKGGGSEHGAQVWGPRVPNDFHVDRFGGKHILLRLRDRVLTLSFTCTGAPHMQSGILDSQLP